jgi:hypothetical protein
MSRAIRSVFDTGKFCRIQLRNPARVLRPDSLGIPGSLLKGAAPFRVMEEITLITKCF